MELDMGVVRGLLTVVVMVLFIGLWARSWSRKRQDDYEEAEQLPLEEDDDGPPAPGSNKERYS